MSGARAFEVRLLGGFQLRCDGCVVETPPSSQRVLAFLGLNDRSLPRAYVAASLWPDTTDDKASASLRTALWRLQRPDRKVVEATSSHLSLGADVWVDVRFVTTVARRNRATGEVPGQDFVDLARGELLPGYWDSWLVFERERLRQETIHMHELICWDAVQRGDHQLAVLAALAAVEGDPLRESASACLITAHLARGNYSEAERAFRRYAAVLHDELGARPSELIAGLVPRAPLLVAHHAPARADHHVAAAPSGDVGVTLDRDHGSSINPMVGAWARAQATWTRR